MGNPIFVLKMIKYFGNSHVFFTLATKKVLNFGGFPNEKCGSNFWDSRVFLRGRASNFWNSPFGSCYNKKQHNIAFVGSQLAKNEREYS